MIKFSAPGYIENKAIFGLFLDLQKKAPEYFYENRRLDSAYGMPGNMIWNGGRSRFNLRTQGLGVYDVVDFYKQFDFKLRHTCTNMFLNEGLFQDYTCNQYIDYCEQENHSIITYSAEFADYIREHYPKYSIIWSTTRRDDNIDIINTLSEKDLLVLDYKYNHDENMLSQLKYPKNIEILCGENCVPDCPMRTAHYATISAHQLMIHQDGDFVCPYNKETPINFYAEMQTRPHAITNEYIDELYEKYGIENFKLSGRTYPPYILIEMLVYYLVVPKYRDAVRQTALYTAYEK